MKKQKLYGFSLLELTIAIFIMGALSALIIANFRKGEMQKRVMLGADTVISALSGAEGAALSVKQVKNCVGPNFSVVINPNIDAVSAICGNTPYDTFRLPPQTQFQVGGTIVDGVGVPGMIVYFSSPFGQAQVCTQPNGLNCAVALKKFNKAQITIRSSSNPNVTRVVTVDGVSGRIQ